MPPGPAHSTLDVWPIAQEVTSLAQGVRRVIGRDPPPGPDPRLVVDHRDRPGVVVHLLRGLDPRRLPHLVDEFVDRRRRAQRCTSGLGLGWAVPDHRGSADAGHVAEHDRDLGGAVQFVADTGVGSRPCGALIVVARAVDTARFVAQAVPEQQWEQQVLQQNFESGFDVVRVAGDAERLSDTRQAIAGGRHEVDWLTVPVAFERLGAERNRVGEGCWPQCRSPARVAVPTHSLRLRRQRRVVPLERRGDRGQACPSAQVGQGRVPRGLWRQPDPRPVHRLVPPVHHERPAAPLAQFASQPSAQVRPAGQRENCGDRGPARRRGQILIQ